MDESRIVVGIDGSTQSLHALDWATQEATRRGVGLTLVSAYTVPALYAPVLDGGYPGLDDRAIRAGVEQVLVDAASQVPSSGPDVKTQLVVEDAAGALVEASQDAGLVVVGTRGRGGFAGRLLGTVSSALPAHAACPTVVVPLRQGQQETTAPLGRVVVGVDGSPSSQVALRYAADEARLWQAELVAVAAVPISRASGVLSWLPAAVDTEQILREQETATTALVEQVAGDLKVRCVVLDGTGAELLTEFSAATDLVVVGSRGRGGFTGLLLGSTSQAVLHHSACAVMVVTAAAVDRGAAETAAD